MVISFLNLFLATSLEINPTNGGTVGGLSSYAMVQTLNKLKISPEKLQLLVRIIIVNNFFPI